MRLPRPWFRTKLRWAPALIPAAILLAFWIPGANQGGWRVDTGLYAAIARLAYQNGQLLDMHTGDQPYFNKPPLAFLIHGAFLHLFGPHLWAARLPSLIAAIACALVTVRAAWLLSGPRVALVTGLVLATTVEYFRFTRAISLDMWQALWLMCAIWIAAEALARRSGRLLTLIGLPLALALLTKQMVALGALPILALWLMWIGKARMALWLIPAALLSLALAAPWHIFMTLRYPGEFLPQYFGTQAIGRATGASFDREPWWLYLDILARTYWPWLPIAAIALFLAIFRPPLDRRNEHADTGSFPSSAAERLCALWSIAWLIALTIFAGKAARYAIVLYPCLAWISAIWITRRSPRFVLVPIRAAERWLPPAALATSIVLVIIGVRIQGAASQHWLDASRELESRGNPDLWASPESAMRWTASNIYLDSGKWPRTVRIDPDLQRDIGLQYNPSRAGNPQPGDLMLFSTETRLQPRLQDELVWKSGRLALVRIVGEWDGRLALRAGAPEARDSGDE